jgi:hypothetical protein
MTEPELTPTPAPPGALFDNTDPTLTPEAAPVESHPNRFAVAGRLGAERIHRLVQLGLKYEQEHGLKRGRQRQRQLIQLGKRYESEHGLAAPEPERRRSREEVWDDFVRALARVVKPTYRAEVERLAATLAGAGEQPTAA